MIDLHMHNRYSDDGESIPSELIEKCAKKEVRMMSVTDHNCVKANEEAAKAAKERGISYISGIEIDCIYKDINFHVLGYGIDYRSCDFGKLKRILETRAFRLLLTGLPKHRR